MKHFQSLIIFLLLASDMAGQYYNTGQDPSKLKWLRIKTPKFDVIYPESYGQTGLRFARILNDSYSGLTSMFPGSKIRIPVVIHNYSTISNGYVSWAPRRMELYPVTDQDAIPGDQHRLLAIHESTHVAELESLNTGFSNVMSYLFGEQFTGVTSAMLPLWYLEGNAVVAETMLTPTGRGRNPSFFRELKAISTEYGNYKYDKIVNGSYRDFVPDHYRSGYLMTQKAIRDHDPQIWNRTLKFTGEQPFTLNPVNISLRRNAGLTKRKLYQETFDSLKRTWSAEVAGKTGDFSILNTRKSDEYMSYHSPLVIGLDSIVAIKTTLYNPVKFVLISGGKEKSIHTPGVMHNRIISYGNEKLVWVEQRPDLRWENRNYSVIRLKDLRTGTTKTITNKTRYLSASVSPDGRQIAAVENTEENKNNLVLLDAETGNLMRSVASPNNYELQRPRWSTEGDRISILYLTAGGEGILTWSEATGSWNTVLEAATADIQSAVLRNDSLFYISSVSGTDNLWVKTGDGSTRQLTDSRFGVSDVFLDNERVLFSNYTAPGNNISSASIQPVSSNTGTKNHESDIEIPESAITAEPLTGLEPSPYRKWQHLFRFHSWMPFYADLENIQADPESIRPGLTLMSQNILSTMVTTLGYEYSKDKRHLFHSEMKWYGWYPVVSARIDYGYRPSVVSQVELPVPEGFRFSGDLSLPLSFSTGFFRQYFRPGINAEYTNNTYLELDGRPDRGQTMINTRIYFSNVSRSATRDIYPRFAQVADINRISYPFDPNMFGSTAFVKSAFYFPGLFRNHGLKMRFEYEKQDQAQYVFMNRISFPRGITNQFGFGTQIISREIKLLTGDYVFPVVYPDFNLSSLLYLKRIRAGLFYDYASATGNRYFRFNRQGRRIQSAFHDYAEPFSSYGFELLADFHLLRIPFEISGGVQAAWISTASSPVISAVFNMDLYGFSIGR